MKFACVNDHKSMFTIDIYYLQILSPMLNMLFMCKKIFIVDELHKDI